MSFKECTDGFKKLRNQKFLVITIQQNSNSFLAIF